MNRLLASKERLIMIFESSLEEVKCAIILYGDEFLSKEQRKLKTSENPVEGHCYLASETLYYLLGGKERGLVPYVLPKKVLKNNTHWWIYHKESNTILDPTAEQFGDEPIPYHLGVACGFMSHPSKRCRKLIERMGYNP